MDLMKQLEKIIVDIAGGWKYSVRNLMDEWNTISTRSGYRDKLAHPLQGVAVQA